MTPESNTDPAAVLRDRAVQRRQALEESKRVRAELKLVRRLIKERKLDPFDAISGNVQPAELAKEVETIVVRWRLMPMLRSIPGIGPARAQEVLAVFRASPRARLGTFSWERRKQLAELAKLAAEA